MTCKKVRLIQKMGSLSLGVCKTAPNSITSAIAPFSFGHLVNAPVLFTGPFNGKPTLHRQPARPSVQLRSRARAGVAVAHPGSAYASSWTRRTAASCGDLPICRRSRSFRRLKDKYIMRCKRTAHVSRNYSELFQDFYYSHEKTFDFPEHLPVFSKKVL